MYVWCVRRPCCGRWRRSGGGDHRHGAGEGDRRPRRDVLEAAEQKTTPSAGAAAPRAWPPQVVVLQEVNGASGGTQRLKTPAGPVHRLSAVDGKINGLEQVGLRCCGRPGPGGKTSMGSERGP